MFTVLLFAFMLNPTLRVENNYNQRCDIFDGGFRVTSVMSGARGIGSLEGRGVRSLVVRCTLAPEQRTEARRFEDNANWRLTIDINGTPHIDLMPGR